MSYNIKTISVFDKNLKKLLKKYPSIKNDFIELVKKLMENPTAGTSLGNNVFKIRMKISSKNKGKSSGARLISNFVIEEDTVYLLTIYDKSDQVTITNKQIQDLINLIDK